MIIWIRATGILVLLVGLLVVIPGFLIDPWTVPFVVTGIIATFLLSFRPFRELYHGSLGRAMLRHLGNSITLFNRFQVIRNGQSIIPSTEGDVFGPRLMVINPGSAVVMEQGGRQTRISGPGIFWSGFFEFARKMYDLRCQQRLIHPSGVLTSDLIQTTLTMCVSYRLNVRPEVSTGDEPLNQAEEQMLKHIDLNVPDWEQEAGSVVQGIARQAASRCTLEELMTAANAAAVEDQIVREANRRLRERGIFVEKVVIENIQPQEDIVSAAAEKWIAQGARAEIELSKANTWHTWLNLLVDAYTRAADANIEPGIIQQEAMYRALQELSQNVSLHITPENSETLREPFRLLTRDRSA